MKVNLQTGEICASGLDLYISGFVPIEVTVSTSSLRERNGSFGRRWSCSLDLELLPAKAGWNYRDASGETIPVIAARDDRDAWCLPAEELPVFEQNTRDEVVLYTADRWRITFRNIRHRFLPHRVEDRHQNGLAFKYLSGPACFHPRRLGTRITSNFQWRWFNQRLAIAWMSRIRARCRGTIQIRHSSRPEFSRATRLGHQWRYQDNGPLMTSVRNPKGGFEYAVYDARQRCAATWRSNGSRSATPIR